MTATRNHQRSKPKPLNRAPPSTHPMRPHIVRSSPLPSDASPRATFDHWTLTGTIQTRVVSAPDQRCQRAHEIHTETKALFAAYRYALEDLEPDTPGAADFRNALVDAMAEYLDWYGTQFFRIQYFDDIAHAHPVTQMERLLGFVWALNHDPRRNRASFMVEELERTYDEGLAKLPEGEAGRETWERFLRSGRCRFHEHGEGKCWQARDRCP
ncbi:hypothetical protein BDV95DRAFT_605896 [Massariosphaeria phaeospora]|uniref:Uncharacterized protein n=1 Tax=Massariosphaeria phaeospora TaxID=100035 RepID=A0A7C8I8Y3_9PLEO|nr:hypothetical protein BDV95DRAFT_605896 [Massariosphaeria phaeospora]